MLANTGVNEANVEETLRFADGVIVGSSLKIDGIVWNPVDRDRVHRLVSAASAARGKPPRSSSELTAPPVETR